VLDCIVNGFNASKNPIVYDKILFAVPDKKKYTPKIKETFDTKLKTLDDNKFTIGSGRSGGPVGGESIDKDGVEEILEKIKTIVETPIAPIDPLSPENVTAVKQMFDKLDKKAAFVNFLLANKDNELGDLAKLVKKHSQIMNLLVHYLNGIECEAKFASVAPPEEPAEPNQISHYRDVFEVKVDIFNDLTAQSVIVDAAGTAFEGVSTGFGGSGGISGAIYNNCTIDNNKLAELQHNTLSNIGKGNVFLISDAGINKDGTAIDMTNIICNTKPIKTIIHAIGPNGNDLKTFTDKKIFDTELEQTLSELEVVVKNLFTTATDPIDLRIPLISSSLYGFKEYKTYHEKDKTG
ncbi:MAG: hypothetical protein EBT39_06830, partial [Sphingobacteriia bacterium]|nr:hypothetical protein [Candidatus Fonsibacter lacus]